MGASKAHASTGFMERATGIEPVSAAWEAAILPLNHGASVVSVIPTRSGNGALDALAAHGEFAEPPLSVLEDARRVRARARPRPRLRGPLGPRAVPALRGLLRAARGPARGDEPQPARPFRGFLPGLRGAASETRLRRRRRRLRLRGLSHGPDRPAPRPIGRAARARRASAFAIGESSSPLANLLLEELADRYDLPRIRPLSAWGTWQRAHPRVGCGLKRGFTFYAHEAGRPFGADPDRRDQLLVAASPCDEVADTHWYRADFDAFLAREAQDAGAEYLDRAETPWSRTDRTASSSRSSAPAREPVLRARFVVDASGPGGFLHRQLRLPRSRFPELPATEGLYAHFTGVRRLDEMGILRAGARAAVSGRRRRAPSRFRRRLGLGAALRQRDRQRRGRGRAPRSPGSCASTRALSAWDRLLERFPTVGAQFRGSRAATPFVHRAASALPLRHGRRRRLGASSLGRRLRGSAALDGVSADAARHRASRRGPRAPGRSRSFRGATPPAWSADPLRSRHGGPPRLGALRELRRLPALRRADDALLRGRELRRGGAASRPAAPLGLVPFRKPPDVRTGALELLPDGPRARPRAAARAPRGDPPRDRALRRHRPSRREPAKLVSRPRRGPRRRAAQARSDARRRSRRSSPRWVPRRQCMACEPIPPPTSNAILRNAWNETGFFEYTGSRRFVKL